MSVIEKPWSRRDVMKGALLALLPCALRIVRPATAAGDYSGTIAALEHVYQREEKAYQMYAAFSRKAKTDGYNGVAYMFFALAASEQIHGRNFQKVFESLGAKFQAPNVSIALLSTKENLIAAANDEMDTIDNLYPETLRLLEPEGNADAIAYVTYAWQSEKQHRDLIGKMQAYSEDFFDRVVEAINAITSVYFVCQNCGSTLKAIPRGTCPVCKQPSSSYRKIERPA